MNTFELSNEIREIKISTTSKITMKCLESQGELPILNKTYLNGKKSIMIMSNPDKVYKINTSGLVKLELKCENGSCKIQLLTS